jgi:hypothetical protein
MNNNPVKYTDPTGHDPKGPEYCYEPDDPGCESNKPETPPVPAWDCDGCASAEDQAKAYAAYLHFMADPGYFAALYADPAAWVASDEVIALELFMTNSTLHTSAVTIIQLGFESDVAANLEMAHVLYGMGDLEQSDAAVTSAAVIGSVDDLIAAAKAKSQ